METATLSRTSTGEPVPPASERALPRAWDNDPVISWAASAGVAFLAAFLRLWKLDNPKAFLFDETYYAKDAWSLVHHGYVTNYVDNANTRILAGNLHGLWTNDPSMVVHPEVGKWIIGLTELVAGMTPFGWRLASAIVGSLMVFVMIRVTRRVTGSTMLGLVGGLLMCFDGMQFVLSRLALLDIFVAFFVLCAVSCMLVDRDWFRARLAAAAESAPLTGAGPRIWWRPWLLAAGVFWGLGLGTKWSALYPLAAFGLLYWAWCSGARRMFGIETSFLRAIYALFLMMRRHGARAATRRTVWFRATLLDLMPGVMYLILLPIVLYVASWTGWLIHADVYETHLAHNNYGPYWGSYLQRDTHGFFPHAIRALRDLYHYHRDVFAFHDTGLNHATHPYQSNPLGWPIINRPVGVDAQNGIHPGVQGCHATGTETCLRQVLLIGTPALWWFSTFALIWSAVAWIGRRDWRYGVVVLGATASWLPWLKFDTRPIFSYYAIVMEPFLILGAVMLLGEILGRAPAGSRRRRIGAISAGSIVVLVIVNFAWFWPIFTDGLLTQSEWLRRIWFEHWI